MAISTPGFHGLDVQQKYQKFQFDSSCGAVLFLPIAIIESACSDLVVACIVWATGKQLGVMFTLTFISLG